MHRINPDIDIVGYIIEEVRKARPDDAFCKSIQHQFIERGSLSKKQLEGLQGKALKVPGIHPGRLATLEAIIKKKPVKERAPATVLPAPEKEKDTASAAMVAAILEKYPAHKTVVLLKTKLEKDGSLVVGDKESLEKFYKILVGG